MHRQQKLFKVQFFKKKNGKKVKLTGITQCMRGV
jgi:hypothetical protein